MKVRFKIPALLAALTMAIVLLFAGVACDTGSEGSLSLDRTEAQVDTGKSITLVPQFEGFGENGPSAEDVNWRSAAPAIAQVSGGVVYGVSEGETDITASLTFEDVDYSATCTVTVLPGEEEHDVTIVLDETSITLTEGEQTTLLPTVTLDGNVQAAPEVSWRSENAQIASVAGGVVTAVAAGNTNIVATVTVSGKEYSAVCAVTVLAAPQTVIRLDSASKEIDWGEEFTLTATVTDGKGNPVEDANIVWESSDSTVATVSDTGTVTATGSGYAVITATAEGVSAFCDVTVNDVYGVTFSPLDAEFGAAYELTEAAVQLQDFLSDHFTIQVERNGDPITDLNGQYTSFAVTADGTSVSVTDTGLSFAAVGTSTVTLQLGKKLDGSTLASVSIPVTVCDQIIDSEEEWLGIDGTKYYVLAADLDFSEGYTLGTGVNLTGTLDGGGHSITATFATSGSNDTGLFNWIIGGTVKNLSLTATYGTLQASRIGALAIVAQNAVTVENCYIRTNYTEVFGGKSDGITGVFGSVAGGTPARSVVIRDTIVAVSAPAEEDDVFGLNSSSTWLTYYSLQNVLVYTSGENVAAIGTSEGGTLQATNYEAFTGGLDSETSEAARTALLEKAEEFGLSSFVLGEFENSVLIENASIAFANASETLKERGTLTLSFTATDLTTNTPIAAEDIAWATDKPAVATVENGVVTGVSAGTAVITATVTVGGKSYSATVSVTVEELITASISFAEGNPTQVKAEAQITLAVTARNLLDETDIPADNITWTSSNDGYATVAGGVVTGVAPGEVTITASVTVEGKTYEAECTITVLEAVADVYEISLAFAEETYNFEVGGDYTTEAFTLDVTATKNGEPWDGWAEYVTFVSENPELLAIDGTTVTVSGTGTVTLTANYSYEGVTRSANVTIELWTQLIDSEEEYTALGNSTAQWSGRYLLTADLDFSEGYTLGTGVNLTGTLDGGGHSITATFATSGSNDTGLFNWIIGGTVKNLSLTATYGTLQASRIGALAIVAQNAVTVENCYIRTNYTELFGGETTGITGVFGSVAGSTPARSVVIRDTIVAVSAPAEEDDVFGLNSSSTWLTHYSLQNVLVYTSGENVAAIGTSGDGTLQATNYEAFTGGLDSETSEAARTALLAKAEEFGLSSFVQDAFESSALV